ncbi:alanine racemase [Nocardioides aestuarii]|uniref:Alanine racemase n=1 Tax=Nocardioides aestuarii TaxID=252231 RepID=A0ABW4TPX1_9ACTN
MSPATPYLEVDIGRLDRNIERVAAEAATAGVALRPHVKTHKSPDIAHRQLAAGAVGVTVATVGEAEVFVRAGVTDVLVAYPLWLTDDAAARVRALTEQAVLTIGVDSVTGAARAADLLAGSDVRLLVEVDSGHHRTGVPPEHAGAVARAARGSLAVVGAFTFPGHSYAPGAGADVARQEAAALTTAAASLRGAGIEPLVLSGGSTPSLAEADTDVASELRPGVYVFGDAQQWELGSCSPDEIALTCRSTVVSHANGRMVLDAGSKVLGADRAAYSSGHGRLLDDPDARVVLLSEHHAVVETEQPLPPLGSTVRVVPNHVCNAVNLVDELWATGPASAPSPWRVAARGRNS